MFARYDPSHLITEVWKSSHFIYSMKRLSVWSIKGILTIEQIYDFMHFLVLKTKTICSAYKNLLKGLSWNWCTCTLGFTYLLIETLIEKSINSDLFWVLMVKAKSLVILILNFMMQKNQIVLLVGIPIFMYRHNYVLWFIFRILRRNFEYSHLYVSAVFVYFWHPKLIFLLIC